MSQQINLLNPALATPRELLTAERMLLMLLLAMVLMLVHYAFARQQLQEMAQQRKVAAETLVQLQEQLRATAARYTPRQPSIALQQEVASITQQLEARQQMLQAIEQDAVSGANAFSGLLRAFARQDTEGLWLTNISMDTSRDALRIAGKALRPELLPEYIDKLSREPLLQGRSFAALRMQTPGLQASGTASAPPRAAADVPVNANLQGPEMASLIANMIDFVLESTEKVPLPATAATVPVPPVPVSGKAL
ncbi:hypothetical protein ED236_05995 [Pseudomethylobacillus aquaticus]|uniref:MSHA biogenesis protein MshI n=1 Tax=Pseudomethylobacillus aquaticus TaxID=2676064 RepID=A0A3N0V417_9PROT|nr:PilN domain-containing protein [Pseudomethylobacillus aquaticus]ROH87218.1 hypothetical protein ED236_05995 [Pseudomethylobacillus aquaticus]